MKLLELDKLYGMDELYNRKYDCFERSLVYLTDGSYSLKTDGTRILPDPPNAYYRHKGGFEGLRQKGWTIFTVSLIEDVCSRFNCAHKLMGQGDNQVLILTLFSYVVDRKGVITDKGIWRMKKTLSNIIKDLVTTFNQVGLPLKELET